jgi:putative heme iron utilization protein
VTVVGDAKIEPDRERAGSRYLRYFPEAQTYFGMHDFAFYRIRPKAIRYIGGFGRINWVNMENYGVSPYPLVDQEAEVIAHMNADHQDALRNCCRHFHQCAENDVTMLGIDLDGFDVRADDRVLRFEFARPAMDARQARTLLVEMAQQSRGAT